ncbi:heat shock protein GrpE [Methyloligella halotolerans]|uniref:Protein GrpE n=1 Tax=Methyloligella halotolerans TaxID=1177755 RepID=A0A1E2S0R1_9HYPH|nr:nucleotide exchange factor GrpE [Methyloligella halotolerans]ODA67909.1 heat shock protein GrpE [Methyloligella halotolerans]
MTDETTEPRDEDEEMKDNAEAANDGTEAETSEGRDDADLVAENAKLRDQLLRTMADMENLRRRTEREKSDTSKYAVSSFARDVLTVGDNLRRTIEHVPAEAASKDPALKSFLDGVELTERELLNMLERHGVKKLDPLGERFDPNNHQAMYEVPNPEVPEGTVVDVMQAGYTIGDRCLRPALVAVSKGGARNQPQGNSKPANDDYPDGSGEDGEAVEDEGLRKG